MSRSSQRVTLPGLPHYVTHSAHLEEPAFREPTDFRVFLHLLGESCAQQRVRIWGYELSGHGYSLVLVPGQVESLGAALSRLDTEYTCYYNLRHMVRRKVWDESYQSAPMCWSKVWDALVYAERDPVRNEKLGVAWAHPWSSAAARVGRATAPAWLDGEEWSRYWNQSQWMRRLQWFEGEAEFGQELNAALESGTAVGGLVNLPEVLPRKGPRKAASRGISVVAAAG